MDTFYLVAAGAGGALIACQFLAGLFGFGTDHDASADHDVSGDVHGHDAPHDHDAGSNWFLGLLTFRSVAAAVTFFGLGGLTARYYQVTEMPSFMLALLAGFAALYVVAFIMKSMYRLRADGTVRMERAVGQPARVYLTIPARKTGSGKVTMNLQNRTVECLAMTAENEITTGATVKVVALLGPDLVEVAPI